MLKAENIARLYNSISPDYDVGTFDQFTAKMQNSNNREQLFQTIKGDYDNLGDSFEAFDANLWQTEQYESPIGPAVKEGEPQMSTFLDPVFKTGAGKPFADMGAKAAGAVARAAEGLDNLAWWVGKELGDERAAQKLTDQTGAKVKPFGVFGKIAEDQRRWEKYYSSKGINAEAGRVHSVMKKVYGGIGEGVTDLALITAFGLPGYSGLGAAGEAAGQEGATLGDIGKAGGTGVLEGMLLSGILKGFSEFRPLLREGGTALLFGGQQMAAEMQKPKEDRDWESVVASVVTGFGLAGLDPSRGRPVKDIIRDARSVYGKKSFDSAVKQVERTADVLEVEKSIDDAIKLMDEAVNNEALTATERAELINQAKETIGVKTDELKDHPEYQALKIHLKNMENNATVLPTDDLRQSRLGYILLRDQLARQEQMSDIYKRGTESAKEAVEKFDTPDIEIVKRNTRERIGYDADSKQQRQERKRINESIKEAIDRAENPKKSYDPIPQDVQQRLIDLGLADKVEMKTIIKNLGEAIDQTVKGNIELYGGTRLGIQPYSTANYEAAKPHLKAAWDKYRQAGYDFVKFSEDMLAKAGEAITPYLRTLEQEEGEPTIHSTPFGDVSAPRTADNLVKSKYDYSGLPLDPYAVARRIIKKRQARARSATTRLSGIIEPEQQKKIDRDARNWEDMHPLERQNLIDKIVRMQQGVEAPSDEFRSAAKVLTRNKANDDYMNGNTKPDDVILQRENSSTGLKRPAILSKDVDDIRDGSFEDLPKSLTDWNFTSMIHLFERMGGALKRQFLDPHIEADHAKTRLIKPIHKEERELIKTHRKAGDLKKGWMQRVAAYGIGNRNENGAKVLKDAGIAIPKWENLTRGEQQMYNWYRQKFDELLPMINESRAAAGEAPIAKDADYVPFMRMIVDNDANAAGALARQITATSNPYAKRSVNPFPFANELKASEIKLKTDMRYMFNKYLDIASEHIVRAPVIAKQRQLLERLEDTRGNKIMDMREDAPRKYKEINEYVNYMAGQRDKPFISREFENLLYKLNSNIGVAVMSYNFRTMAIQPSAFAGTVHRIGLFPALSGAQALTSKAAFNEVMNKSKILDSRYYDVYIQEMADGLLGSASMKRDKLAEVGLAGLKALDMVTAVATWKGAYNHAIKKQGLSESGAIRFADDVVLETQASASPSQRAKIQRSAAGRAITLFGTFNINQFSYIRRNVLGLGNKEMSNADKIGSMLRWGMVTGFTNAVYESMGIRPPMPAPLIEGVKKGIEEESLAAGLGEAGAELLEYVPIAGGTRYTDGIGGAAAQTAAEAARLVTSGEGGVPKGVQVIGKTVGIPGTQQVMKTYWQIKANAKEQQKEYKAQQKARESQETNTRRTRSSGYTRRERK